MFPNSVLIVPSQFQIIPVHFPAVPAGWFIVEYLHWHWTCDCKKMFTAVVRLSVNFREHGDDGVWIRKDGRSRIWRWKSNNSMEVLYCPYNSRVLLMIQCLAHVESAMEFIMTSIKEIIYPQHPSHCRLLQDVKINWPIWAAKAEWRSDCFFLAVLKLREGDGVRRGRKTNSVRRRHQERAASIRWYFVLIMWRADWIICPSK